MTRLQIVLRDEASDKLFVTRAITPEHLEGQFVSRRLFDEAVQARAEPLAGRLEERTQ